MARLLKLVAPLSLLLTSAVLPAVAHASATVGVQGTTLTVTSTAVEENTIGVARSGGDVVVAELNPLIDQLTLAGGAGPCTLSGPSEVRCPGGAVTALEVRLGPGDDALDALGFDLPLRVHGEDGRDAVTAGYGTDRLDGGPGDDDLSGEHGGDTLDGGPGRDYLDGGGDRDKLLSDDGEADKMLVCGAGDDDLDDDPLDPFALGCEAIAPRPFTVTIDGGPFTDQGLLVARHDGISIGNEPPTSTLTWIRCGAGGCVEEPAQGDIVSRLLTSADAGSTFAAVVTVTNRAGSATARSATTPTIAASPPILIPGPPTRRPEPALASDAQVKRALSAGLRRLAGRDIRRAARRGVLTIPLTLPFSGTARATLTVPAATARRHGLKVRGGKAVVLGTGAASGIRGQQVELRVRLTARGRTLLRRAKRLRIDAGLQLTPSDGSATRAFRGRDAFTLRRR